MIATQQNLKKRLQFILHRGFVEIRNLAYGGNNHEQIAELADAMEILPRYLDDCSEEDLEMVRFVLRNYEGKYPLRCYDYLKILEGPAEPPDRY